MIIEYKKTILAAALEKKNPAIDFTLRQGTKDSAGYDLPFCVERSFNLQPGEVRKVGTGIILFIGSSDKYPPHDAVPYKVAGIITPRSSVKGLVLENTIGIIDHDYQGELQLKIRNVSDDPISIKSGEKKVQIIFIPVFCPNFKLVSQFDTVTSRNAGGFGSTGG
jgi:dUTP pyrophosphatase